MDQDSVFSEALKKDTPEERARFLARRAERMQNCVSRSKRYSPHTTTPAAF